MSISSTNNRNNYIGTGLLTTYAYGFRIFSSSHLILTKRTTAGIESTLVLNTDYTVTGVGDASGGTIVLTTALESGYTLSIRRVLPLTQPTDLRNQGAFFPETHEDTFDRGLMIDQQQQDEIDRSIKFAESEDVDSDDTTLPGPEERAGGVLGFDAEGDIAIVSGVLPEIVVSPFMETLLDDTDAAAARSTLGIPTADGVTLEESAGTLRVKDLGISTAKLANSAVTTVKIADANVTADKLAAAVAGNGLTGGAGSALAVNVGTGLEISSDAVRIATAAAGNGLSGGGGSALAVNVDDSTIEINSDSLRVKDAGITEAKLAAALVAKLGLNIGLVARVTATTSSTSYSDLVNISSVQGRLRGIAQEGNLNAAITIVTDGVDSSEALVGNSPGHYVSAAGNQTSPTIEGAAGAGNLNELDIFFRTSLIVKHRRGGAGGVFNTWVAYERSA